MQIEIKIDEFCTEPKITIITNKVTDEINEITKKLAGEQTQLIAGFQDEQVTLLEPNQIYRIFASNGKVYAETELRKYVIRLRLYEMEQRLIINSFVRISNSEKWIKKAEMIRKNPKVPEHHRRESQNWSR